MFEGFFREILLGFIGQYVKGFQKDQLKIGVWREEILLEKVELISEAFDYLQLPFRLKTGRVGKLSIKVPWKKFGWEPIIIALEDVFICACQREDSEWSSDSMERRELAGKMAKLNAIELAKFSRRVSDNPAGQSFLSYIYAKALDNIQVSIRNVHVIYSDSINDLGKFIFGLRFSTLTIMTDTRKKNSTVPIIGKSRSAQVNKIVEISDVGFYCNLLEGSLHSLIHGETIESQLLCDERYDFLINPFDVSVSLVVNKSGKLDGSPQYAIITELTTLVVSLNEIQLEQILGLCDNLSICTLREKYGRYRPPQISLSLKHNGWQILWWHYAQESVLADVRQKLKKASWKNLGRRIIQCLRYVDLYKRKLELLQQEQLVHKDILNELEKMDKECDIDDILNFRCIAEHKLQEDLKSTSITTTNDGMPIQEKQQSPEQSASRARGWLNWLSLGMLGAGGTADSSAFAGVVSDEIIKDIYQATEFHPIPSFDGDSSMRDKFSSSSIKINISQIVVTVSTGREKKNVAKAIFGGISIECKIWEDSIAILALTDSVKMINPSNDKVMLIGEKVAYEGSSPVHPLSFINIQVDMTQPSQSSELLVKVMVQPFETTFELDFFLGLLQFCHILTSFQFQHNRVLLSLNGFGSFKSRLLSKAEYLSFSRKKVNWDICLHNVLMKLPLETQELGDAILALQVEGASVKSRPRDENVPLPDGHCSDDICVKASFKDTKEDTPFNLLLLDLYDHFDIGLTGLEVYVSISNITDTTSIIEKFNASIGFQLCMFFDEPDLKAVEVDCGLPFVVVHFSPTIFYALAGAHNNLLPCKMEAVTGTLFDEISEPEDLYCLQFSVSIKLDQLCFHVDFAEEESNSSVVSFTLTNIDVWYAVKEYPQFSFIVKLLKVEALNMKDESQSCILCLTRNGPYSSSPHLDVLYVAPSSPGITQESSVESCLKLDYHSHRHGSIVHHESSVSISNLDLHIYPRIFGLIQSFFCKLRNHFCSSDYSGTSFQANRKAEGTKGTGDMKSKSIRCNIYETESAITAGTMDHFPFVNIPNSGYLSCLEGSLISGGHELQRSYTSLSTFNSKRKPRIVNYANVKSPFRNETFNLPEHLHIYNVFLIDIILDDVRVYFHDSSCILGAITLPKCRSSLSYKETDCWDVHIATDGLILSSSWSPPYIREHLWGPASPDISPVVDIRLRKQKQDILTPMEISISIRHVSCILSPDFLAMVIGYFALPDWKVSGNEDVHDQYSGLNSDFGNVQGMHSDFLCKIEILHSRLILPVETNTDFCLQLGLPRLYFCFIPMFSPLDADKDIPFNCAIPTNPIIDRVDVINVFGRSTSLSLISVRNDVNFLSKADEHSTNGNMSLIEQLDADLWIRTPCKTMISDENSPAPTLVMTRVDVCDFIAEDKYLFTGVEALHNAINGLSSVGKRSLLFSSDVLQFLQARRTLDDSSTVTVDISNETIVCLKLYAKALSVKFSCLRLQKSASSEMVAKTDLELNISASFRRGVPEYLDIDIPRILLYSFPSNIPLASFVSRSSMCSHLCVNFSRSEQGEMQLLLTVPSLDVWLHLFEWNSLIDVLCSYTGESAGSSVSSCANPHTALEDVSEPYMSPCFAPEYLMQEAVILTIKSVNTAVSIHLPVFDKEEKHAKNATTELPKLHSYHMLEEDMPSAESKHQKYVEFTLQSRHYELAVGKSFIKLECNMEKLTAVLKMIQNQNIVSTPFIQIFQLKLESESHKRQEELMHISFEVKLDSLDVGISYQILNFWSCNRLKLPARTSTPIWPHCLKFKVHLGKGSLLLSDGRWNNHGPILEILTKNTRLQFKQTEEVMEGSANSDIVINYSNIDKVMWEPFVEPCSFQLNLVRKYQKEVFLNTSAMTDISLETKDHLHLNITEPVIEAIFRVKQLIDDALDEKARDVLQEGTIGFQSTNDVHTKRYAPYILRNDTSLPLTFHVSRGPISRDDVCSLSMKDGTIAQPGHTVPIYVEETFDEQYFRKRTAYSSERLLEKNMTAVAHHMISIQLEGTTGPSRPMSMDLVGLSYFEVNFSNNQQFATMAEVDKKGDSSGFHPKIERSRSDQSNGLVVPVVFEVSMQHYSKMIRLYSTVLLQNATSMPLELRFDIPFGLSPKVLGPILPGQEIPLPLHLAEAGRMRWRPLGSNYLWSEAHSLPNILSQENRPGFLRSFLCYPSHPSSDPFRCCISVQDYSLSPSGMARKCFDSSATKRGTFRSAGEAILKRDAPRHLLRQVKLTTPLSVKNYLPIGLSLLIENGGVTHSISLSEVDSASIYLIDSTHDLGITFHIQGFRPVIVRFPRAESFCSMAKLNGCKFYFSETLSLYPETSSGPTYVNLEKAMDESCGAREICLSVPFLLYNCSGLLLTIVTSNHVTKGNAQVIPSSYQLIEDEQLSSEKEGLPILTSELESSAHHLGINTHTISTRASTDFYLHHLSTKHFSLPIPYRHYSNIKDLDASGTHTLENGLPTSSHHLLRKSQDGVDHMQNRSSREVKPYMYAPFDHISASEVVVKVCASMPHSRGGNILSTTWSIPFPLVPASGSTNVTVPEECGPGAFLISVTSCPVAGELSGRTRAVTFQPRYVICNACSKDLCYRQKGTNAFYHLGVGQHSHLHWSDTTRELYISIRFNERGWQWSGSFLPDCLGDVQVKMHNYVSGTSNMVRVEVQNADMSICDKRMRNSSTNSSQLIVLSDDKTGFTPYRIDNFTMEKLRIYQQKCEPFETTIHAYASSEYAWDEPCYPHRLVIEVPGERILGTYALDNIQEYVPVSLPSTPEKPERSLHVSICAEGATKVLSIIDSSYHVVDGTKESSLLVFKGKSKGDQKQSSHGSFGEVVTLHFPFIGISLINSYPQELVFASMKDTTLTVMQSSDQQEISFQILSVQIDNQLSDTPYPIMLSFDNENKGRSSSFRKNKEYKLRIGDHSAGACASESTCDSVFYMAAAKWRNADASLISFKYINLRLAPLCIELEEQVFLRLLDFFRTVSSRLRSRSLQKDVEMQNLDYGTGASRQPSINDMDHKHGQNNLSTVSRFVDYNKYSQLLPSVIPIGAPWQQIYLSARRQRKIYVEVFELAPISLSFSFSSTPWMIRNEEVESLTQISTTFQRGLMALVDVEGVPVHLGELMLEHLMASHDSIQEIVVRHYTRQLLHEIYKVLGSAGVIGNPMGFARNVGLAIKDFFSVSSRGIVQSPVGLVTGILEGSKSLVSNTVYAVSSATTQFSKAAHKGIVAFTFDEQAVAEMDVQLKGLESNGKGLLNEFLEGLTGLLQSPIRGAEKHGLPGILSGIAMGTAGLIARPMASIFEATGKTAQSIRNRSSPHLSKRLRVRLPRPLSRELPLSPYSWEEAVGVSMLLQADGFRLKDETFVLCKALKQAGKFIVLSEKLVFIVYCSCLVGLGSPEFVGVSAKPEWVIETAMSLESIVHVDRTEDTVSIVGSSAETMSKQKKTGTRNNKFWSAPTSPLFYMRAELPNCEVAEDLLQVLLSTIEQGKERRWGMHVLHRSNLR